MQSLHNDFGAFHHAFPYLVLGSLLYPVFRNACNGFAIKIRSCNHLLFRFSRCDIDQGQLSIGVLQAGHERSGGIHSGQTLTPVSMAVPVDEESVSGVLYALTVSMTRSICDRGSVAESGDFSSILLVRDRIYAPFPLQQFLLRCCGCIDGIRSLSNLLAISIPLLCLHLSVS